MSKLEPTRTYSNPTATDILRRMLDERGVEWMPVAWNPKRETFYHAANGVGFCADEYTDGVKIYTDATITPEQAIAATLGSCNCSNNCTNSERTETCHMEQTGHVKVAGVDYYDDDYECSECGAEIFEGYNFCPMCGRRIEQ